MTNTEEGEFMLYYKTLTIVAVLMVSFAKNANASLETRLGGNSFYDGSYGAQYTGNLFHAWAVHDGDVASPSTIPEPSTYIMLLAGLGALGYKIRIIRSKS